MSLTGSRAVTQSDYDKAESLSGILKNSTEDELFKVVKDFDDDFNICLSMKPIQNTYLIFYHEELEKKTFEYFKDYMKQSEIGVFSTENIKALMLKAARDMDSDIERDAIFDSYLRRSDSELKHFSDINLRYGLGLEDEPCKPQEPVESAEEDEEVTQDYIARLCKMSESESNAFIKQLAWVFAIELHKYLG